MRSFPKSVLLLCFITLSSIAEASVSIVNEVYSERQIRRISKKQDRIHKKFYKIQGRLTKVKRKAGALKADGNQYNRRDDLLDTGLALLVLGAILGLKALGGMGSMGTIYAFVAGALAFVGISLIVVHFISLLFRKKT